MLNHSTFDENYNWANEYFVLYEAPNELIVLHRNMCRNEEFVIMTTSLITNKTETDKFWCVMAEHYQLLEHVFKIKRYQRKQDNFKFFNRFFNMTFDEFVGTIPKKT